MGAAGSSEQAADRSLSDAERTELRERVRVYGEGAVCAELFVSRQTLGRGIAGLDLQRGTVALIRQGLERVR